MISRRKWPGFFPQNFHWMKLTFYIGLMVIFNFGWFFCKRSGCTVLPNESKNLFLLFCCTCLCFLRIRCWSFLLFRFHGIAGGRSARSPAAARRGVPLEVAFCFIDDVLVGAFLLGVIFVVSVHVLSHSLRVPVSFSVFFPSFRVDVRPTRRPDED